MLNIVDDWTRECRGQIVDFSISSERMARYLDELAMAIGLPEEIVLDNGRKEPRRRCSNGPSGQACSYVSSGQQARQNAFIGSFKQAGTAR
ncbi:MAG: hypothetical protein R3D25_21085 [Geminicoccaceae bacterium]